MICVSFDVRYLRCTVSEIWSVAAKHSGSLTAVEIWDRAQWSSYVKGALAFLLSARFEASQKVRSALMLPSTSTNSTAASASGSAASSSSGVPPLKGLTLYVSASGLLRLPSNGGMSSSAALTGAFALALNALCNLQLSLPELAQSDFGEYFLGTNLISSLRCQLQSTCPSFELFLSHATGKMAGAADKMAQLNAARDEVVFIGSFPECVLGRMRFPTSRVAVVMADCPTPRLSMRATAKAYLSSLRAAAQAAPSTQATAESKQKTSESKSDATTAALYSPQHIDLILDWAAETMARFASVAYVKGVESLVQALSAEPQACSAAGLSATERQWLLNALYAVTPATSASTAAAASASASASSDSKVSIPSSAQAPLLRGWCTSYCLEQQHASLQGWAQRHNRYALIFKALRLLPETAEYPASANGVVRRRTLWLRKACLYGLSETERGVAYQLQLNRIRSAAATASAEHDAAQAVTELLRLVRLSHDADRACVDYRTLKPTSASAASDSPFLARAWASDARASVSDATITQWIQTNAELVDAVGGFER
jgi:galactokinase